MTLVEVCLAMMILITAGLAGAHLITVTFSLITSSRLETSATVLADQKLEQLRALAWSFVDVGGLQARSDTTTDLSQDPLSGGGPGLAPSSTSTLDVNTAGYVDFLDRHGRWVGTGTTPPPAAVFIRRWSVTVLPIGGGESLLLRVLVRTVTRSAQTSSTISRRLDGDALVASVLTRKAG